MKQYLIAVALVVLAAPAQAQDNMKAFPPAEKGMVRCVLHLPKHQDESSRKVELMVGKTVQLDEQNRYFFGGKIEASSIKGWGFTKYTVSELGHMAGTLMAVNPNAPKVKRFVSLGGEPYLIRYNSMDHRSEAHSRTEDWQLNLPATGIREMCSWDRFCTFAREPERGKVGLDARVSIDGISYQVDPDLAEETVVLLSSSSGGSGVRSSVAVVGHRHGQPENLATRLLGDRVQLRSMRIDGGKLSIDVVRAGPDDPACCPGELATYSWRLAMKRLEDDRPPTVTGRLSAGVLAGTEWVLRSFAYGDEAPAAPVVTLAFAEAQLGGKAGCNGYFAAFADMPDAGAGALRLGPVGATQMMCPDGAMAVEDRYLRQLGSVSGFGFMNGRLMLSYPDGVMLFDRTGP